MMYCGGFIHDFIWWYMQVLGYLWHTIILLVHMAMIRKNTLLLIKVPNLCHISSWSYCLAK